MILGSDVFGRSVLGQIANNAQIILQAGTGSFAITGTAATFSIKEAAAVGSFALSGVSAQLKITFGPGAGTFAYGGFPAPLVITQAAGTATFTITGYAAFDATTEPAECGNFSFTFNDARLERTGFDYDVQQGGVGHYLLEMERAKQLAKITRTIPPPVDRRTAPTFRPLARPPVAPIAPAVDMAAIQQQRMGEAAAKAKAAKKRRDEEAILLLAS